MSALTEASDRGFKAHNTKSYPVAASTNIYKGALVAVNTSGYAVPAADTTGYEVVGVSIINADNSSGSNGDEDVQVNVIGVIEIACTSAAQTWVGKIAYAIDDNTVGILSQVSHNIRVGQVVEYVSSTLVWVRLALTFGGDLESQDHVADPSALTIAAITDNSGGVDPGDDTIAAITNPAALELIFKGYCYYQNVAASAGAADQEDISAGGATFTADNPVQPDVPRNIKITVTDADTSITSGTITVAGTDMAGESITEVFDVTSGLVQEGSKIFAKLTGITGAGFAGNAASDTVDFTWMNKLGVPAPDGAALNIVKLVSGGTEEAAAATDTTYSSMTPTTAPDGAVDYEIWFEYTSSAISKLNTALTALKAAVAQLAAKNNAMVTDLTSTRAQLVLLLAAMESAGITKTA